MTIFQGSWTCVAVHVDIEEVIAFEAIDLSDNFELEAMLSPSEPQVGGLIARTEILDDEVAF